MGKNIFIVSFSVSLFGGLVYTATRQNTRNHPVNYLFLLLTHQLVHWSTYKKYFQFTQLHSNAIYVLHYNFYSERFLWNISCIIVSLIVPQNKPQKFMLLSTVIMFPMQSIYCVYITQSCESTGSCQPPN